MSATSDKVCPPVVIIGAGLAGLSAAYGLKEAGYSNFKVLEASNRLGGRVRRERFQDGTEIDLGPQWLHGSTGNPVYSWLNYLNLIERVEGERVEFDGKFANPRLCKNQMDQLAVAKCLELLVDFRHTLYEHAGSFTTRSLPLELYRIYLWKQVPKNPFLRDVDKNLIASCLRWFEVYESIDNSCNDLSDLSMKAYSEWKDYDDGKMLTLKGGWSSVVTKLANYIGRDKISINCEVIGIDKEGVTVRCGDVLKEIKCEHVIITVSIGVLRSLRSDFFSPDLCIDEQRMSMIQRIGFDPVNKIFLLFDRPFLKQLRGLKLLWTDEDIVLGNFPEWARGLTGFDLVHGHENVLVGWVNGEVIERVSESEVIDVCERIFEYFLGKEFRKARLINLMITKWGSDRFIRGSYSYKSVKTMDTDESELWKPVNSSGKEDLKILFAGEATSGKMYATAHGAVWSGWREAARLILHFQNANMLVV